MSKDFYLPDKALEAITAPSIDFTAESFGAVMGDGGQQAEIHKLAELNSLLDRYIEAQKLSGMEKWFVPGTPFSIDSCPKHKTFFSAGQDYGQRLFMAANR